MSRVTNSRRMPISGSTRHDMSVAAGDTIPIHHFVETDAKTRTDLAKKSGLQSRSPIVSQIVLDGAQKTNNENFFGVSVTGYEPRRDNANKKVTSSAPVCVVAVAGPVTVHYNWRKDSQDTLPSDKMTECRTFVGSRGLVLHDTRPGNAMDVVLYDSFDRVKKAMEYLL